jgi:hypothetical protein
MVQASVNVSTVGDSSDGYFQSFVINLVDDPVVSLT